jgi:hypothetical protein
MVVGSQDILRGVCNFEKLLSNRFYGLTKKSFRYNQEAMNRIPHPASVITGNESTK